MHQLTCSYLMPSWVNLPSLMDANILNTLLLFPWPLPDLNEHVSLERPVTDWGDELSLPSALYHVPSTQTMILRIAFVLVDDMLVVARMPNSLRREGDKWP